MLAALNELGVIVLVPNGLELSVLRIGLSGAFAFARAAQCTTLLHVLPDFHAKRPMLREGRDSEPIWMLAETRITGGTVPEIGSSGP